MEEQVVSQPTQELSFPDFLLGYPSIQNISWGLKSDIRNLKNYQIQVKTYRVIFYAEEGETQDIELFNDFLEFLVGSPPFFIHSKKMRETFNSTT